MVGQALSQFGHLMQRDRLIGRSPRDLSQVQLMAQCFGGFGYGWIGSGLHGALPGSAGRLGWQVHGTDV